MEDAFEEAIRIYEEKIDKFEPKSGQPLDKSFSELDWFPRSYWEMRPATVKTEDMIEGLKELQPVFKDLWPWGVCYNAQSTLREITDNAVYTWEHALLKHCEDGASTPDKEIIDKLKKQTLEKFRHDAEIATFEFCAKVNKQLYLKKTKDKKQIYRNDFLFQLYCFITLANYIITVDERYISATI